jgi:hypothetical protein
MVKGEKKQSEHYVNNREFSSAIVEYVNLAKRATEVGKEPPRISNYIGECIMKICEGLSHKPNFVHYSYRDEMVMDGVENCIAKIVGFDRAKFEERKSKVTVLFKPNMTEAELIELGKGQGAFAKAIHRWYKEWNEIQTNGVKITKEQLPNAFAYFTQIAFNAFLRRIGVEKKQWAIKLRYIESASIGSFADFGDDNNFHDGDSLINKIRGRTSSISHKDDSFIEDEDKAPVKPVKRGWGRKVTVATSASLFENE